MISGAPAPVLRQPLLRGHLLALAALHLVFYVLYFTPRLREDAPYYYEPLRSAFFDGDVNYYNERPFTRHIGAAARRATFVKGPNERQRPLTGGPNNTFDIGTTLLEVPFFLGGHLFAKAMAAASTPVATYGYGPPYVLAMSAGFLVAALVGTFAVYAAARSVDGASAALWGTALATWGSFMPAYFYEDTLLSHLPSYVASALLLWLLGHARRDPAPWLLFATGATFSWLLMARRQNGLLLPLLAVLLPTLLRLARRPGGVRAALTAVGALSLGGFLFVLPQLSLWRLQYGSFLANPGMVPLRQRPVLWQVLLSDHGGLFSHSPILIAGACGLLVILKRDPLWGALLGLGVAGQILINALRVEWWPGIGYGNRRSDSLVPILALGLAALIGALQARPRRALLGILVALFLWNMAALPQFYATDGNNEKGSFFASYSGQRAPARARVRWPMPAPAKLPALLVEDAAIVARQSFTLRGGRGAVAALAFVAATSLGIALAASGKPPGRRLAAAVAVALPLALCIPPLAAVAWVARSQRTVLAIYYDPPEPREPLSVGRRGFTGGVVPIVLPPGEARSFDVPAFQACALEVILGGGPSARACVLLPPAPELEATASAGRTVGFPNPGRHQRLELPGATTLTALTIRSCGSEPVAIYGIAAVAPGG